MSKDSPRNKNEKTKSKEIGKRLQDLRLEYSKKVKKPKIRQGEFGKLLGIGGDSQGSRDTLVGRLERGECDIKPSELQKYSRLCGVSIDYIVNGSEYEQPTQEFTFLDLCKLIIKLDKCGLILLKNDDSLEFFQQHEPDYEERYDYYGRPVPPDPELLADVDRRIISKAMKTFLRSYRAAQELLDNKNLSQKEWLVEKAIEGAVNDFETTMNARKPAVSADQLIKEMKDGTLIPLDIPDPIDEELPF